MGERAALRNASRKCYTNHVRRKESGRTVNKKDIRKEKISALKKLSGIKKQEAEEKIYANLFRSQYWQQASTIALTMAQEFELNTLPIVEEAWKTNKTIVMPRAKKNRVMDFVVYNEETPMVTSSFGLIEPDPTLQSIAKEAIDLVVVPGLAFSKDGYRVGFGGGYYDRFLVGFSGTKVALVLKEQQIDFWTPESFDIPMDTLITEEEIILTSAFQRIE